MMPRAKFHADPLKTVASLQAHKNTLGLFLFNGPSFVELYFRFGWLRERGRLGTIMWINGSGFYRPDATCDVQLTVSEHCRELNAHKSRSAAVVTSSVLGPPTDTRDGKNAKKYGSYSEK